MLVRLVLWNLADSKTTFAELRRDLRHGSVDSLADVPGLRLQVWVSDEVSERWGAISVWESAAAADRELPGLPIDLIGKQPEIGESFDVEATIEGRFAVEQLSHLGLAFEE